MFNLDALVYIPLLCTAVLALAHFVLLIVIKKRRTAKVSLILLLAVTILFVANLYTFAHQRLINYAMMILLACAILIPYVVMLAFGKPKEYEKIVEEEEQKPVRPEVIVEEIEPEKVNIIEKGREFIQVAADKFGAENGMQELLDLINKTSVELSNADGGAVLMVDDFDDAITVKSFTGDFPPPYQLAQDMPHKPLRVSTSFKYAQFPLRENIFGEVASAGKAELITDPSSDDRIFENKPEPFLKLGSFIFVPISLRDKGIVIGLIALSKSPEKEPFSQKDFEVIQNLTEFAESALKSIISFQEFSEKQELKKESDIATDLQNVLLPKKLPPINGVSFGSIAEHTEGVCSDIFDVIPARSDRISFILLDVAGKGTNSFLVMSMIRAMFRLVVNTKQTAGTIVSWANRGICSETSFEHFASAALINFDPNTKKVQLATAGTTPVLLYSKAKGAVERKSVSCDPIGVEKTASYKDIEFTVQSGDIIITYTDGLVEALNAEGKQYSVERLTGIIKANNNLPGNEIAKLVKDDIKKFIGAETLHDDQTLLIVKIK